MIGIGRTDKPVIGDLELVPKLFERGRDLIGKGLCRFVRFDRRLFDLLAMFVRTGQKIGLFTRE